MCYAIPGQVKEIEGKRITLDYFGKQKKAINELNNLTIGDYVYAQAGYIVEKLPRDEAKEILVSWREIFFHLNDIDLKLSQSPQVKSVNSNIIPIIRKIEQGLSLDKSECLELLSLKDKEDMQIFFRSANLLRQKFHQNACCVHGIIEISNHCRRNCYYCGISCYNQSLKRYRMRSDEILSAASKAVKKYRFKALVLQAGEDSGLSIEELVSIVAEIKRKLSVFIVVSFGEIGIYGLRELYKAGARGILLRFETSNPLLYSRICPGHSLDSRIKLIREAKDAGYLIITGSLLGIPGQTNNDIINDINLAKELDAEMLSFGPFLPHPNTPLAKELPPDESLILKTLALARCLGQPDSSIVVTTAFETLSKEARYNGFLSGANSLMLNVTPLKYRPFYSIYPNRAHQNESLEEQIEDAALLLKSLGRVNI